jgi:AcrR family transcriptional regulator
MKGRRDRILDVAVALAEEGGFENVRQRDVAARAGVALGTLYKSFRSKEDILSAALDREAETLERRLEDKPSLGNTSTERVSSLFSMMTRGLCKKPKYARAVLRAMASGEPEVAGKVAAYQERITGLIIAAMRGVGRLSYSDIKASPPSTKEATMASALQQFWFAALVGWSAGLIGVTNVVEQMRWVTAVLDRGIDEEQKERSR